MKRVFGLVLILALGLPLVAPAMETTDEKIARMRWFEQAKLGIFIHWGIYAVNGIDESWSFKKKIARTMVARSLP